ncbi:hypothetical protein CHN50_01500 [Priestia aryabhattai]|uniref:ABC transporter permease n=1 Tax=Bacillaceae TaxID=186817 RepID=UPI000BA13645|nr:ABC transporter permease [Bacillus sp. CBEL-1]OZT14282.1 hypothetical protein CHN50_01500 [Priestia aryabhattai]TDB54904.1 hypothetical protein EPL02_01515 [Bacillus sp. CBEL-1]
MAIWDLVRVEVYKMYKSKMTIQLIIVSPLIAVMIAFQGSDKEFVPNHQWLTPLVLMCFMHSLFLLPLFTGVLASLSCKHEHDNGGWRRFLTLPVKRSQVYLSKFITIILCTACIQLLFFISWILVGKVTGYTDPMPLFKMTGIVVSGWIATWPIAAFMLFMATKFTSFGAVLVINVICTLPNLMVVNSERFNPWYPWVQPFLGMMPQDDGIFQFLFFTPTTLLITVLGSFIFFFLSGLTYFKHKAI